MEQKLELIKHPEFGEIRVEKINGQPWFCAKDICKVLNLSNPSRAVEQHCFESDLTKSYIGVETGTKRDGSPAIQMVEMNFINESGLYALIFNSEKEQAKKFKHWVTSEVLPSLRKTGTYDMRSKPGPKLRNINNIDVTELLWLIDENLMHGDKKRTALELGVTEKTIISVLNGRSRNPRILRALYDKAIDNRYNVNNPYSADFIEAAILELR